MSELVTTKEIAELLGISIYSVLRRVRGGKFPKPSIKNVNLYMWDKQLIDAYMEENNVKS